MTLESIRKCPPAAKTIPHLCHSVGHAAIGDARTADHLLQTSFRPFCISAARVRLGARVLNCAGVLQPRKYLRTITTSPKEAPTIVSIISARPRTPAW